MFQSGNYHLRWQDEDDPWIKRHSLSIAVTALFVAMIVASIPINHVDWVQDTRTHGEPAVGYPTEFWWFWLREIWNSITAEPYGFLIGVLLTKWFYEKDSAENSDE